MNDILAAILPLFLTLLLGIWLTLVNLKRDKTAERAVRRLERMNRRNLRLIKGNRE